MEELIEKIYYEAVADIDQTMLENSDEWYNYVVTLPIKQRVTYTIIVFHGQIENGGFHQYFFNAYGQFGYLTVDSLKLIGSNQRADMLQTALDTVNSDNVSEHEFRYLIFERKLKKIVDFDDNLFDFLDDLSDKYYHLEEENIDELLMKYLQR